MRIVRFLDEGKLKWGVENGYHLYDFGGAGRPDVEYGVRDFKAKFGGTLVNYGRNICVHAPTLLHLSRWGYVATAGCSWVVNSAVRSL